MSSFFLGTPGRFEQQSLLGPEQKSLYQQLLGSAQGRGAGGAFGQSADYYRNLLSDDSQDIQAFQQPEMRRFQQDTIPGLAEQFAGMGSGALSSSGFRNAAVNAGTDLSERLAAIRANLRQQAAQGLQGIGEKGLGQFNENIYRQGQPGLLEALSPAIGTALGAFGGPVGAAAGGAIGGRLGDWIRNRKEIYGNQNPVNGPAF